MNISSIRSVIGFQSYKPKCISERDEKQKARPVKPDTVELSNKVLLNAFDTYLDGSYLDDPKFQEKFDNFIENYLL